MATKKDFALDLQCIGESEIKGSPKVMIIAPDGWASDTFVLNKAKALLLVNWLKDNVINKNQ